MQVADAVNRDLFGFQIVLLILIFTFWLIGARILPIYAVVQLPCAEMVADFGAGQYGKPVFERLLLVSFMLGLYWGVIGIVYSAVVFQKRHVWFHLVLFVMTVLLGLSFGSMTLKHNNPPDGVVSVETRRDLNSETGRWVMGQSYVSLDQRCLWLDRGVIVARIQAYGEGASSFFSLPWYSLQDVKDLQVYRPLTPEERERYLRKQTCLDSAPSHIRDCDFGWVFSNAYIHGEDAAKYYPLPRQGPRLSQGFK